MIFCIVFVFVALIVVLGLHILKGAKELTNKVAIGAVLYYIIERFKK